MSDKLVIITEKPSAFEAFKTALNGQSGTFDGHEFALVHLYGHVIGNSVPDDVALPEYKAKVGKFANLSGIPWDYRWFDFNNKKVIAKESNYRKLLTNAVGNVDGYLKNGYTPVIASDIDPSGEGDLLVREVLIHLNYHGKTYREYHLDETPNGIQKSLKNLKEVTEDDPTYKVAFTRSNMDYLTQQLTRVATMTLTNRGYKLPAPVPFGRLKSVIVNIVGDQEKAIDNYKPSSVFESRYQLGKLQLTRKDMPQYKTKEEWTGDGLPTTSKVHEVKQVNGQTQPPKPLYLDKLVGAMGQKGVKAEQTKDLAQKLYEAHYMTYPRTEDSFVSPEQFNEMLPIVDPVLDVLDLPKQIFTHRTARPTHVKTGGSHGALRPGTKIPKDINQLDSEIGPHASEIYKLVGERFMSMFLENTEWTRHIYETTDTPEPFTGAVKIITKQGVVDPDDDQKDVETSLPDVSKPAELIPYEVKSTKPHKITLDWIFSQLGKAKVGQPATRVSTVAAMSGRAQSSPLVETKTLKLSPIGWIGYEASQNTVIGSVDGTKQLTGLIEGVRKGADISQAYDDFTNLIATDVQTIEQNTEKMKLEDYNIEKAAPKEVAQGNWEGNDVTFNRIFMGHRYTDEELTALLAGETIEFPAKTKDGRDVKIKGKLANKEFKGHKFVGIDGQFVREGYVSGTWNGEEVTVKKSFMDHQFTDDEMQKLFAGEEINLTTHKDDKEYKLKGKLARQTYKDKEFVGFKAEFPMREGYTKGTWQGKEVTIKKSFMDHEFTDAELKQLFANETLKDIETHKGDKTYHLQGKLEVMEFKGRKFVGFKAQFLADPNTTVTGTWNGKTVTFKNSFMQHKFSDEEIKTLLAGQPITFEGTSQKGKTMDVTGQLGDSTYQGKTRFGFVADFGKK